MENYLSRDKVKTILETAPKGANKEMLIDALVSKGYILEGYNEPKPEPAPEKSFGRNLKEEVLGTLIVNPAQRATEALGKTGVFGETIKRGFEEMEGDRKVNVPVLGEFDVPEVKAFGDGGGRQIAGETLKVGSFLFPYGKVAGAVGGKVLGGATKLTPSAIKTAQTTGNVASGLAGGYMADVGFNLEDESKTLAESFIPGFGTIIGGAIPLAGPTLRAGKTALSPRKSVSQVTGRVLQGQTKDIPLAEQAFQNIDLTGVKTRQELSERLAQSMEAQMNKVDEYLARDTRALSLDDYAIRATNEAGQEVKTDYISRALDHLEDFFRKAGDDVSASNLNLIRQKTINEGLTHQEVNNIARMYSEEFGSKAFNKMGDPLTSVNAQMYENTRQALKQASRGGLGYGEEAMQADRLYSAMSNTKRLIDNGVEGVNKLEQRLKDYNVFQKLSRNAVKFLNTITGGSLKAGIEALGVSNVGNKIDNWVNLERSLAKDLEFIQKANSAKTEKSLIKVIEDWTKTKLKFPGDAMVDDLSARGEQIKNIPNKQGGFIKIPGGNQSKLTATQRMNNKTKNIVPNSSIPKTIPQDETIVNKGGKYLYHGTNETVLENITKEGLQPGRHTGNISLSPNENYAKNWSRGGISQQGKTEGVMLRVNREQLKTKILPSKSGVKSDQLNELISKDVIPPEAIEVYKNGKWQPLVKSDNLTSSIQKAKSSGQSFDEWVKGQGTTEPINKTQFVEKTKGQFNSIREVGGYKVRARMYDNNPWQIVDDAADIGDGESFRTAKTIKEFKTREDLWRYIKDNPKVQDLDLVKAKDAILQSPTLSKAEIETIQSAKSFDEIWDIVKTKGADTQGMFTTRLKTAFEYGGDKTRPQLKALWNKAK